MGILASKRVANYACYQYISLLPDEPSEVVSTFDPINGGSNQACRGDDEWDNSDSYFVRRRAGTLETCEAQCLALHQHCYGIEYHQNGRCELWTREIKATKAVNRYECFVRKN